MAVVLWPTQDADVDEVPTAGEGPVPLDAGVRRQNHVRIVLVSQVLEEGGWRRRFPEEILGPARAAVTEEQPMPTQRQAALDRQFPQPGTIDGAGVGQRVFVADGSEMVVARVGVTTLAIGKFVSHGVIVVATH